MSENSIWYLENIDVTGIFCPKKLGDSNNQNHSYKNFKKGEFIYMPDEFADKLFFISEGRVKIGNTSIDDKEITKAILGPGEVFGELAMFGNDQKRRDFAVTMETTTLCVIPKECIKEMMKDHNGLNLFFMKILGNRALDMEKRLESLVFKDSRSRIVEYLIELASKKGQRVGYETLVRKFITHQEIANLTATSRQTVTTTLNELRNKNLLTFDRKRLLIRDMDQLKNEI